MATKQVGDRIKVLAHEGLGTPETMGTIVAVHPTHYEVICDDEIDDMVPTDVTFEGEAIYEPPFD